MMALAASSTMLGLRQLVERSYTPAVAPGSAKSLEKRARLAALAPRHP